MLLGLTGLGLELEVVNIRVIEQRDSSSLVLINLDFDGDSAVLRGIQNSYLCVLINGRICACFDEPIHGLSLRIPEKCYTEQKFWFSVAVISSLDEFEVSNGILIGSLSSVKQFDNNDSRQITLVLTVNLADAPRAQVLLESLVLNDLSGQFSSVYELLIVVPDNECSEIASMFLACTSMLNYPVLYINETSLFLVNLATFEAFKSIGMQPYAIQMSLKLLIASRVQTEFYITLDSDVVQLNSFTVDNVVTCSSSAHCKAIFHNESRYYAHPHWYSGSEAFLGIESRDPLSQGFGVTPAALSTYGSLLTLSMIAKVVPLFLNEQQMIVENYNSLSRILMTYDSEFDALIWLGWANSLGKDNVLWTEYTLYRTALDYLQLFHRLHVSEEQLDRKCLLLCGSIWYADQLPWKPQKTNSSKCLFSVIQSTTGVTPFAVRTTGEDSFIREELEC